MKSEHSTFERPYRCPPDRRGRNVVIDNKSDFKVVTKEGVTFTKEIELENPMENLDVQRKS